MNKIRIFCKLILDKKKKKRENSVDRDTINPNRVNRHEDATKDYNDGNGIEYRDGSSGEARFSTRSIMTGTVLPGPRSNQSKSRLLLPIQPATSRFSPVCLPWPLSLFPTPFPFPPHLHLFLFLSLPPPCHPPHPLSLPPLSLFRPGGAVQVPRLALEPGHSTRTPFRQIPLPGGGTRENRKCPDMSFRRGQFAAQN